MWIEKYLNILCCPKCKGELEYKKERNKLVCKRCKKEYEIIDNIPILKI
ncbi:Trm112 family protein [Methanocaldococcus infernus]|uniref:Trm112 family protein n=1 Tax=Methanocaldococcus infernus (strain DSM 11812 / JCM 15783 / ME) TaxID=573063 RepID=D5VRD9_METIM|nr:Trm112 family protein [Methanocaldococcus infernus]ADG13142.1 protein of unknown function DUF343 [Methanocaldococcus infernus ME]